MEVWPNGYEKASEEPLDNDTLATFHKNNDPNRAPSDELILRLSFARLFCVMAIVAVPEAWVVRCNGCRCIITAFATDPQAEHLNSKEPSPPYKGAVHVTCSCCWGVYRYLEDAIFRGQPQQSEQCKRNGRQNKPDGALLVAAKIGRAHV